MPALTPTFLTDLETRMSIITEREYERLRNQLWWTRITKTRPSTGLKDIITWLLSTAQIKPQDSGGNIHFDDLVAQYTTIENKFAGAGLKLQRRQLEDTDGGGIELSAAWSGDIGAYMAYWPQREAAYALKHGHDATKFTTYDTKAFFATDHPVNPFRASAGTYTNIFTGGSGPGAVPIDDSVTADVALVNLSKAVAHIASYRMPNGDDPRFLRPAFILAGPRLYPRVVQLTSAKFLAQAATGGAASADVEALIKSLGFATPVQADELAGFEADKTWFIACEQLASSQLGALIYTEREPFKINYYGTVDDAVLGRAQELEWQCIGRNVISGGHPYLLIKCQAT